MTTQDVLRQAKELLSDERRWCTRAFARDSDGRETESDSPDAVSFCTVGAIDRVAGRDAAAVVDAYQAMRTATTCLLAVWNDAATHADVIAAFDRALLLVAKQEAREAVVA